MASSLLSLSQSLIPTQAQNMPTMNSSLFNAAATRKSEELTIPAAAEGKWDARFLGPVPHDASYYGKCMLGGILSCGLTHTIITPLDVIKCNSQVNPAKYPNLIKGGQTIIAEEGALGLLKGWGPTAIGYSMQGFGKFGFYEIFKDLYANIAGEENSVKYRRVIWLAASASAEFIADVFLCPSEMTKVKVQTSVPGSFPTGTFASYAAMNAAKSETGFPFRSLSPLWSRQIPYTMAKFYFYQEVVEMFYTHVFTAPKETYGKGTQLGVAFGSGYIAGVICAIVSHPADSLVSLAGKPENKGKAFGDIIKETGWAKLATAGLGTRIIMIGTLTGLQWWIYDAFKTALGMGTTGGKVEAKK